MKNSASQIILIFFLLLSLTETALGRPSKEFAIPEHDAAQEIIDKVKLMILDEAYDSHSHPGKGNGTDGPTKVQVTVSSITVKEVDEVNMNYKIKVSLRQSWRDSRLKYENSTSRSLIQIFLGEKSVAIPLTSIDKIWTPDLYIANQLEQEPSKDIYGTNTKLRIYPCGIVELSQQITLTLNCPIIMQRFPMDTQVCPLRLASYAHTTQDIVFEWTANNPMIMTSELDLPLYILEDLTTEYCDSQSNSGVYSCLLINFWFTRALEFYLKEFYLPCILIVFMAGLVPWLSVRDIVSRVLFILFLMGLMSVHNIRYTVKTALTRNEPNTTMFGMWLSTCWIFLILVLVETILVYHWDTVNLVRMVRINSKTESLDTCDTDVSIVAQSIKEKEAEGAGAGAKEKEAEANTEKMMVEIYKYLSKMDGYGEQINLVFRFIYPLFFIGFVLVYVHATTVGKNVFME